MLTDSQIITRLVNYGHLGGAHLAGIKELSESANVETWRDAWKLTLKDKAVKEAIASFQGFMVDDMERLSLMYHKRTSGMLDSFAIAEYGSGDIDDPAVRALFEVPRCGMPDLSGFGASGSWSEPCRSEGVTFFVDPSGIPSSYAPFWDEIKRDVIAAYRRVGAAMKEITDKAAANIFNSFPSLWGSTIGLASLHAGSCSSKGFCRLDTGFRCNKEDAKRLLGHEWGHNWNHNHTRSGEMAPSLNSSNKPYGGWEGDPAMSAWIRFTGGKPLPPLPGPDRPVTPDDFLTI